MSVPRFSLTATPHCNRFLFFYIYFVKNLDIFLAKTTLAKSRWDVSVVKKKDKPWFMSFLGMP